MAATLRALQFWIFLITCTYLSLTSLPNRLQAILVSFDKAIHFAGYLFLLLSLNFAYRSYRHYGLKSAVLFIFSLVIEVLQHYLPYRRFSAFDLVANISGISSGVLVLLFLSHLKKRFTERRNTGNIETTRKHGFFL